MASRTKQAEGLALLSMYNDDDDECMEYLDEHQREEHQQHEQEELPSEQNEYRESNVRGHDSLNNATNTDELPHEATMAVSNTKVPAENDDSLGEFLPPPPKDKCPEDVQEKIAKFIDFKECGRSFNAEVRNRKDNRNPDFLQHAVRYQEVDEIGSCFSKDVFDPHGFDLNDFYYEIEADMRCGKDKMEQELKKSHRG